MPLLLQRVGDLIFLSHNSDCTVKSPADLMQLLVGKYFKVVEDVVQVENHVKRCTRHSATTSKRNFEKGSKDKKAMAI